MKRKLIIFAVITALCLCGCGKKEDGGNYGIFVIEDYPAPDYEYQLFQSDDVILGEVTEKLDSWFTNPDGKIKELNNALLTPYKVKVEKSYKGLFAEGETVIVNVWNGASVNSKSEIVPVIGAKSFYLRKGQRGVFMLEETEYVKSKDNETMYNAVYEDEGLFEPKGTNEEGKEIYASPSFEITLDRIPGDIAKAHERYGDALN